ncbi:MAG TPA: hypothetical protein VI815_03190 [Candidatus Nanoarchaeia archaeon]|nr:hypothetical protein [Candidatus Nanoarchaeia archaeon]
MIGKRGLSEIIVTILLILLSVVAVTILAVFLIPFVRDNLEKEGDCLDVLNKIEIVYESSCYSQTNTSVRVKFKNINVSEIYIVLENETTSENYRLKGGESYSYILSGVVLMPSPNGGERSYIFNLPYKEASVGAVTKSGVCDISDVEKLNECKN